MHVRAKVPSNPHRTQKKIKKNKKNNTRLFASRYIPRKDTNKRICQREPSLFAYSFTRKWRSPSPACESFTAYTRGLTFQDRESLI
ncbi:hypothetical protein POVWA2_032830 [Plasmodium ovale wallikeri]|uniref:Uncharacterized protein n=1 Tax=Plasmodium ovale wallikeri TaxID=864142 RepID=A0A1A8YXY8_PLAOA|nr:hypothetical protein POVWA1_033210 [Plasmodium ovale wallikeri]SBT37021.1 hypothetical protein POVWA2_032830 [Plasmodium ovale wallikeri]